MFDHLTYKLRACEFLSQHLKKGTLTLFLGAGASSGLGLPGWIDFVNICRKKVGLSEVPHDSKSEDLQIAADEVEAKCKITNDYLPLLKDCLYQNMVTLSSKELKNDLLIALGALLMGSKRGSVQRVVTLNFDSILEWFLSVYGFITRVIYQLPAIEGDEDVRIYHPHGFLPHKNLKLPDSDFVILGLDSINQRIGTPGDQWFEMIRYIFRSGVCIFVGLSETTFSDRALSPLLTTTAKELENDRPTGIWLFNKKIKDSTRQQFLRNNVVPLELSSNKEISDFLLDICSDASKTSVRI